MPMPSAAPKSSTTQTRGAYRRPGLTDATAVYLLRAGSGASIGEIEIDANIPRERADMAALLVLDFLDPVPPLRLVD